MSQCDLILRVLSDGQPHSVREIHARAGYSRLNSRVAELRKRGHVIECRRIPGKHGTDAYEYTLDTRQRIAGQPVTDITAAYFQREAEQLRIA